MKCEKLENGIRLIAENQEECLQAIAGRHLTARFTNEWNQTGPLVVTYPKHPWDKGGGQSK
jgi:hypothetical protein